MALTNSERVKRWRERHRALHNLRRREYRKRKGGDANCAVSVTNHGAEVRNPIAPCTQRTNNAVPTVQPAGAAKSKIDELRELVANIPKEIPAEAPKPLVYRNDYGQVISEAQWKKLQARKEEAERGGYVLDEFSQA